MTAPRVRTTILLDRLPEITVGEHQVEANGVRHGERCAAFDGQEVGLADRTTRPGLEQTDL
jgi:hypothetical protein